MRAQSSEDESCSVQVINGSKHIVDDSEISPGEAELGRTGDIDVVSPLNPRTTVHLCTFSPCIEQVQRTISTLRQLGWIEIEMVEIAAKRIEVRRERIGIYEEGLRGVNASPASVAEAVARLRVVEGRSKSFHDSVSQHPEVTDSTKIGSPAPFSTAGVSKQQRLENIREGLADRKLYKEGRLVHRTEQELKCHTSYLVFALLPREWTTEDEQQCRRRWPSQTQVMANNGENMSRRQMKKAAKIRAGGNKAFEEMREEAALTKRSESPKTDPVDKAGELS